jgi:hypothetical protein
LTADLGISVLTGLTSVPFVSELWINSEKKEFIPSANTLCRESNWIIMSKEKIIMTGKENKKDIYTKVSKNT